MRNVNGEAVNGEGVGVNGEGVNEVNEEVRGVYRCRLDSTELCCVCVFTTFFSFSFFHISRVLRDKQHCYKQGRSHIVAWGAVAPAKFFFSH